MKALDVLSALLLEDGRPWGQAAAPVQWRDATAFLADDAPPYAYWARASAPPTFAARRNGPNDARDPGAPRLALGPAEAAAALGVGLTSFNEQVLPELRAIRRGRRVIVPVAELTRWLEAEGRGDRRDRWSATVTVTATHATARLASGISGACATRAPRSMGADAARRVRSARSPGPWMNTTMKGSSRARTAARAPRARPHDRGTNAEPPPRAGRRRSAGRVA